MGGLVQDLGFTVAALRRRPGLVGTAAGLLAVAMFVLTLLVAVAGSVLLRPLAYPEASRLGMVHGRGSWGEGPVSYGTLLELRQRARSLDRVEGFAVGTLTREDGSGAVDLVPALRVTPGALEMLGAGVAVGRGLEEDDARAGAAAVAVLTWPSWREWFACDPSVAGRSVGTGERRRRVVGVLRRGFVFPLPPAMGRRPEVVVPYGPPRTAGGLRVRDLVLLVRRAPGASWAAVRRELSGLRGEVGERLVVVPLRTAVVGEAGGPLRGLLAAAVLIAALAACNLAILLLARADARGSELAVRVAVGASPGAVFRLVLIEAVVLAGLGTGAGLAAAAAASGPLRRWLPASLPRVTPVVVDRWVVAVVAGVAAVAAVAAAVPAAVAVLRVSYASVIKGVGSLSGGGRWAGRLRRWLVAAEVSLAATALTVAVTVTVGAARLLRSPLGFDPEGVVTVRLQPVSPGVRLSLEQQLEVLRRVAPEAEAAALATAAPLSGVRSEIELAARSGRWIRAQICYVTAGFFEALGVPRVAGRTFRGDEVRTGAPVALVSRGLAAALWRGTALGRRLALGREFAGGVPVVEVVGIVGDVAAGGPASVPRPTVYLPLGFDPGGGLGAVRRVTPVELVLRTAGGPRRVEAAVREALRSVGARAVAREARRLGARLRAALEQTVLLQRVLTALTLAALALACGGVYGLVAFWLVQRRRELGVRAACGATPARLAGGLLGEVLRLVVPAAAVGATAGVGTAWYVASRVPGLGTAGAPYVLAVLLVAAVSGVAGALPGAVRATRIDPATALRYE